VPAWTVLLGEAVWQALIIALSPFAERAAAEAFTPRILTDYTLRDNLAFPICFFHPR
jgi:hypothetical protein